MNLCEYGCGREGHYQFTNGKWCCSKSFQGCDGYKNKWLRGNKLSKETRKKISEKIKYIAEYNEEYKKKQIESRKQTLNDIQEKYPFFCIIEEIRKEPKTKEIQVRCKNSNCENSKEMNGWFTPSYIRLYERIRQLEKDYGKDGCFLYCSKKCKNECQLSHVSKDPFQNQTNLEHEIWRKKVLERENYNCEYCGEEATHAHHEKPQKLYLIFTLDPDNGIACCIECHYKYGHKTGTKCSTGNLANEIC